MTQFDLRQAITKQVQRDSIEELTETIEAAVDGDENALPGLGVLFEIIWQQSPQDIQQRLVESLHDHLHGNSFDKATPSY